jgi:hypothetical protein
VPVDPLTLQEYVVIVPPGSVDVEVNVQVAAAQDFEMLAEMCDGVAMAGLDAGPAIPRRFTPSTS